jgi:thiol:disulfide interchange protein
MLSRLTLFLLTAIFAFGGILFAQTPAPVKWSVAVEPSSPRLGESGQVVVTAKIDNGWYIYSPTTKNGPIPAEIKLLPTPALTASKLVQPTPKTKFDEGFQANVEVYEKTVKFAIPFKVAATKTGDYKANISVRFQACNDRLCLPPKTVTTPANFIIESGEARSEFLTLNTSVPEQAAQAGAKPSAPTPTKADEAPIQRGSTNSGGVLPFMGAAFLAGLLAILTPCVFPMIPITVSLFSKRGGGLAGPIAYCAGIIGTFTLIGVAVSALFGASGLSLFAANPIVNIALATLFIVLALNLFGVFEIIVPASILQKVQPSYSPNGNSGKQSLMAPLLMGFAFTLTSFTCTVPFVGTALVSAATQGALYPALGMLSFATAFALPFFLLALFPSALSKLPRSGEWLVSVKAFMGFLELAAALKFLQTADYTLGLGLITRPVFLAIWFAIAVVAGFYLLRWLRLPKDSPNTKIGPFRYTLGTATLGVAVWLLAANNGVSLKDLDAYLPPKDYGTKQAVASHWLKNDLDGAIAKAKEQNKPLLINFTGYACTNCRLMENNVLPHSDVTSELGDFVPVELFTDGSDATSRAFNAYQQKKFGTVAIPMFAVVTPDGEIKGRLDGLERDPAKFAEFLRDSKAKTLTAHR